MVDWDRVDTLRARGWTWDRIASDPRVGFHPDRSVHEPGPALRAVYHRHRMREGRSVPPEPPRRRATEEERRWTPGRIGALLTPFFAVWFLLAYFAPSPVGLILPAVPFLLLGLAAAAFLLLFGLWRTEGRRWTRALRGALAVGVALGLVVAGLIAVGGIALYGCPVLPSSASARTEPGPGWTSVAVVPWQDTGRPVLFSYGSTWCPFCSASTWAIWKTLASFEPSPPPTPTTTYSAEGGIPEVVLSGLSVGSSVVAFEVAEDTSGVVGSVPPLTSCTQRAYVGAYSDGAIPFVVVNGQYVHGGSSLVPASALQPWANGANGGVAAVLDSVEHENGSAWTEVQGATWWLTAFVVRSTGTPVGTFATEYGWSTATRNAVTTDLAAMA